MSKSSTPTSNTVQTSKIPDQLLPYYQSTLDQATTLSNQPYQAYGGQRLADQNQQTTDAYSLANQMPQSGQQAINSGIGALNQATSLASDPNAVQQYMNPYENSALESQIGIMNQQFGQQQNERNSAAVQAGAFGGDRAALVNNAATRDYNNQTAQMVASGEANAYNTAQQTMLGQEGILNQTGNSLVAGGGAQQNQLSNSINSLYNSGQSQQNYQQSGLDIGYNDFLNQQQYPYQQLNYMSGILNGFNVPASTSTSVTTPSNPVSQLAGAGVGIAGLSKLLGSGT